jgi:arylsulfatase A-like enzyme
MTVPAEPGLLDRRAAWAAPERSFSARRGPRPFRPNIVFIFADDLGWGDLGAYGSLHNRTPEIDQLARDGIRFTHAYATSATCSPTRIGLYTGRYPSRLVAGLEEPLGTRDSHHGIPHDHPTLPSLLRADGYRTAMFGKWHCGWLPWFSPIKAGFEVFFGNLDGAMDYFSHIDSDGRPDLYEGDVPVEEVGYYTDLVSARAVNYIREVGDEPFYLQVNFTAPHWPWEGPGDQAVSEKVTAAAASKGALQALFHFEGGSLEAYSRLVASLDEAVGRILGALDQRGLRDNTIVVFSSDNGGERFAFLWPFVGEKGDLEEGGIRIPFIVRWPAAVDPGQVSPAPNVTIDWTATLLETAGARPDPAYPLDGVSLLPLLLDGDEYPRHDLLWRTREQGAIRRGRFKLLIDREGRPLWKGRFKPAGPSYRLFDITVDGREKADISRDNPDVAKNLRDAWEAFDLGQLPYPPEPPDRDLLPGGPD